MRLYMQRLPDGSYQCYCNQYELNNHPFMVDKTLTALYDYYKEALQGRAEWDIERCIKHEPIVWMASIKGEVPA